MEKIIGYSYNELPNHKHDCEECIFLFGVNIHNQSNLILRTVDVYEQCQSTLHPDEKSYLIRYSSDGPDYISGLSFRNIVAGYIKNQYH
jgi:hypothetical protein